jgi:hypothetical protein
MGEVMLGDADVSCDIGADSMYLAAERDVGHVYSVATEWLAEYRKCIWKPRYVRAKASCTYEIQESRVRSA